MTNTQRLASLRDNYYTRQTPAEKSEDFALQAGRAHSAGRLDDARHLYRLARAYAAMEKGL